VDEALPALLDALDEGNRAILVAAPGAGKTTRVPSALLAASWCRGKVIVLEPRRIAARSAAAFVSRQAGDAPGGIAGYRVRMEIRISAATRIEFVTEGVFTRMILDDPELSGVSAVIFDEFHERNLDGDLGLALALDAQQALRDDLRILVMSATLDASGLSTLLDAPVIESSGRSFPVAIEHRPPPPQTRIEDAMAQAIISALRERDGSILAFLPGQGEIRRTAERLESHLPTDADLFLLYGGMESGVQDAAIRPPPPSRRKVVLATSVAETSITIDGVRVVIDSGLARVPRHEPQTGLTRLETVRAARSSVDQRAGRAGRTAPGTAIRLWREEQTASLPARPSPEIREADLTGLALDLAAWGVTDPGALAWPDPPPAPAWKEAVAQLREIGALDAQAMLTPHGRLLRAIALPPRLAAMVARAAEHGQAQDAARIAVLLQERGLGGDSPDLSLRLDNLRRDRSDRARKATALANGLCRGLPSGVAGDGDPLSAGALLSLAWPGRVAHNRGGGRFRLANGRMGQIGEEHALAREPYLAIADLQGSAQLARIVAAAAIGEAEIFALHAARITETREVSFDAPSGGVRARVLRKLDTLTLREAPVEPTQQEAADCLCAAIARHGLRLVDFGKEAARLRERIAFLHRADPAAWPDVGEEALVAGLTQWLVPFWGGPRALADIAPAAIRDGLRHLLLEAGRSEREVEAEAPEFFVTPAGSRIALRYEGEQAIASARVQEFFGLSRHPAIAGGKLPLTLELLSPANRPIQVTRDLPRFWTGSWAQVRAEMRGRYPRHPWPEDPAQAAPTTRAKPRGQ
jgi:ATP-dependent helicase HrpB